MNEEIILDHDTQSKKLTEDPLEKKINILYEISYYLFIYTQLE